MSTTPSIERRCAAGKVEIRSEEGRPKTIRGYAAVFNSRSENLGGFVEIIQRGAFRDVLAQSPDVRALLNHNADLILGRTKSGTLKIGEDDTGLWYEITPADTQVTRDLMESIRRGDLDQSSFAFSLTREGQDWKEEDGGKLMVRTIKKVSRLMDVSIVAFPAYAEASVALRTMQEVSNETLAAQREALAQAAAARRARELQLAELDA